jgi:hypothetical protein
MILKADAMIVSLGAEKVAGVNRVRRTLGIFQDLGWQRGFEGLEAAAMTDSVYQVLFEALGAEPI